jgi:phage shock protein E
MRLIHHDEPISARLRCGSEDAEERNKSGESQNPFHAALDGRGGGMLPPCCNSELKSSLSRSRLRGMISRSGFGWAASCVTILLMFNFVARADDRTNAAPKTVKHADAKTAAKLVEAGKVTVLDVRTHGEFTAGHIAGATNVDFLAGDFAEKATKLDRQKTYLVHCGSGRRSTNCLPQLQRLGFTNLVHLDGGLKGWEAAGNPIEKK